MSDSDDRPEVLLQGAAEVQLTVSVPHAYSPEDAVNLVIAQIARRGLDAYLFAVGDTGNGATYLVQGGRILDEQEVRAVVGAGEEGNGDPGQPAES